MAAPVLGLDHADQQGASWRVGGGAVR